MKDIVLQAFEESTRVKEQFAKENADVLVKAAQRLAGVTWARSEA